jgi:hypothetical protein
MIEPRATDEPQQDEVGAAQLARLRELVRRHQICWESRPEYAAVEGTTRQVGFVIEITATHEQPHHAPVGGCPECEPPLHALEAVVAFVLPKGHRESIYDVHVRRGAIEYDRRRWNRPEVSATIRVLHGEGADRPLDPCEERCHQEIIGKLGNLGACEGTWSSTAPRS